jgi:flagellar hook protein FlgE
MMRSLFSGVSGLKSHQTRMDTIGNNIANVNTTGFKSSRTTFADTLSQTLTGASAPSDNLGGTNPKQIGLGTGVASIDTIFTDGSVQSTGKNTDLCLSGNGLFVVKKGSETYYTRDGAFEFDAKGNYVLPSSGLYVQGWTATDGTLSTSGAAGNITIPSGKSMASKKTSTATYSNNLNASTEGKTISSIVPTYSDGTSETLTSYPSGTISLGLINGSNRSNITLDSTAGYNFTTGDSVKDKALYKTTITSVDATGGSVDLTLKPGTSVNAITYADGSTLSVTGLTSSTYAIGDAYTINGTIDTNGVTTAGTAAGETQLTVTLTSPTEMNGKQVKITVPKPEGFTYKDGDSVSFDLKIGEVDAAVGSTVKTPKGDIKVTAKDIDSTLSTADTTTDKLKITTANQAYQYYGRDSDGTVSSVTRTEKTATSLSITTTDGTTSTGLSGKTYAKGDTFYSPVTTTITAYDSLGEAHKIPVLFTKTADNTWSLSLSGGKNSTSITDSDGTTTTVDLSASDLIFDTSGKYVSGSASITLTPTNGAAAETVSASLSSLTQYAGNSTINASSDGNAAGTLSSVSIDSTGTVTGTYTNGVKQTEAQVAVAQFNNASGLTKTGNSLYQESNNSGTANVKTASDLGVTITPSALEMSNVDIANEFSDMIITQRGFQSNSKIITVGDEMLETLIGMKR